MKFFDYNLAETLDDVLLTDSRRSVSVLGCLNPHSFVTAMTDSAFHDALKSCDFLLPDGEGICLTMRWWGKKKIRKIAGDDIHNHLLSQLDSRGGKVYYMGSTPQVLSLIEFRLAKEHPSITVRCWSPSICAELSEEESNTIIADINAFSPDVLFVSMTAPKQEKWVERHRSKLSSPMIVASIGAVFDFYACTVKRAPKWAVKMRTEWLFRLLKEPRRMWRRNFISTPVFLWKTWRMRSKIN